MRRTARNTSGLQSNFETASNNEKAGSMIHLKWKTSASIPPSQLSTNSTQPSSIFDYHTSEKLATNFKITTMKLTMKLAIAP
jgi:hypothetical protein